MGNPKNRVLEELSASGSLSAVAHAGRHDGKDGRKGRGTGCTVDGLQRDVQNATARSSGALFVSFRHVNTEQLICDLRFAAVSWAGKAMRH